MLLSTSTFWEAPPLPKRHADSTSYKASQTTETPLGLEDHAKTYGDTASFSLAAVITFTSSFTRSQVILVVSDRRSRDVPELTVGGRMARTAKPFFLSSAAKMQRHLVIAKRLCGE